MKATDLMAGDYVRTIFSQKIVKVKEIKQSCIYTDDNGYEYNEIEPISLTPEALERNGFVVESRDCHGEPLQYCVLTDGLWIDVSGENYFEGKLEFVHQLQHALRLCEIDKIIEL